MKQKQKRWSHFKEGKLDQLTDGYYPWELTGVAMDFWQSRQQRKAVIKGSPEASGRTFVMV